MDYRPEVNSLRGMTAREHAVEALLTFASDPGKFCTENGIEPSARLVDAHTHVWAELYRRASGARPTVAQAVGLTLQVSPRGEHWQFTPATASKIEAWLRERPRLALIHAPVFADTLEVSQPVRPNIQRGTLRLEWVEYGESTLKQLRRRIVRDLARLREGVPEVTMVPPEPEWRDSRTFPVKSPAVPSNLSPLESAALEPVFEQLWISARWRWALCRHAGRDRDDCVWFLIRGRYVLDCFQCRQIPGPSRAPSASKRSQVMR